MRDDDLLRRIDLWATGATIHNVKNLKGAYRSAWQIIESDSERATPEKKAYYLIFQEAIAKQMAAYMLHGDYKKAGRDFPLPEYPFDDHG